VSELRGGEDVLVDLAARSFGGAVVWANDESFAGKENLIRDEPPTFTPRTFGARGQVYDGWETRRRRDGDGRGPDARDEAIVRLGAPGVVREVGVDTSYFTGNYPVTAAVEASCVGGHPSVGQLRDASWRTIVARTPLAGDAQQTFPVDSRRRWTHVRLGIYPDGGVARLRVHGEVVADPRAVQALGTVDLARTPEDVAVVIEGVRVFLGYAGWAPGQLEGELAQGAWIVADFALDDAFGNAPLDLWRSVLRRQGGRVAMFANAPGDPRSN